MMTVYTYQIDAYIMYIFYEFWYISAEVVKIQACSLKYIYFTPHGNVNHPYIINTRYTYRI